MRKDNTQLLRGAVSTLFSFLLSLVLLGMTVLAAVQWGCFSRGVFYRNMAAYDYYEYVKADFYEEAEDYTLPTGLDLTVLEDIVQSYDVYQDVNGYIDAAFGGRSYQPDLSGMQHKLRENVSRFFEQEGMPEGGNSENVEEYLDSIARIYQETVKMPLLDYLMKAKAVFFKLFLTGLTALAVIGALLVFLIFRLHRRPHRGLRYLAYSTGAAGLMAGVVPAAGLYSGFYRRIHLEPEYFYNFAIKYVENLLTTVLYLAGAWLIAMGICLIMIKILKKKERGS